MNDTKRFEFGKNWQQFLDHLNDERIQEAVSSLKVMLDTEDLEGKSFLDIGSGSGLFSLAAYMLGAEVYSFDYDTDSVACTQELKNRYAEGDDRWRVERGSVLDLDYMEKLGTFEVVYSWGVLHHTGDMYAAIENTQSRVATRGTCFISIYNDQGPMSRIWLIIKRFYNLLPSFLRPLLVLFIFTLMEIKIFFVRLLQLKNPLPFARWRRKKKQRGMSVWYDWVDWVGGYPFEVARPEQIVDLFLLNGYSYKRMKTLADGHGCNEYVFSKDA